MCVCVCVCVCVFFLMLMPFPQTMTNKNFVPFSQETALYTRNSHVDEGICLDGGQQGEQYHSRVVT